VYNDYGVTPGVTYIYYVKAAVSSSGTHASGYSDYAIGYASCSGSITVTTTNIWGTLLSGDFYYILYNENWTDIDNSGTSKTNKYTFTNLCSGTYHIESYVYYPREYLCNNTNIHLQENEDINVRCVKF
jgi:hypothetical protein